MKQSEATAIFKEVVEGMLKQLNDMNKARPGAFKKRTIGDLEAGCRDGARMMLHALQEKGHLTIEED